MTVSTTEFKQTFIGNSIAESFSCQFKILSADDISVTHKDTDLVETVLVYGTDYSVTGAGDEAGFTITFPLGTSAFATLAVNEELLVVRAPSITQTTDLRNQSNYNPESVEDGLDRLVMILQWLDTAVKEAAGEGNAVDFKDRRGINASDPVNDQDVVTLAYLVEALANAGSGSGVVIDSWSGTTDGGATYDITGAVLDDANGYIVSLDGVLQQPDVDFTVDINAGTITFAPTPSSSLVWFATATGLANTINQYPASLNGKLTQHIGSYVCTGTDTYTLTSVTGQQSCPSLRNRQIFVFSTPNANTSTSVSFNADTRGAMSVVMQDGSTLPEVGYFTAGTKVYIGMYETSSNKLRMVFPEVAETPAAPTYGTRVESGAISGVSSYAFTGIPAGVNKIDISFDSIVTTSGSANFAIQLGYGSTTYITADYDAAAGRYDATRFGSSSMMPIYPDTLTTGEQLSGNATLTRTADDKWSLTGNSINNGSAKPAYFSGRVDVTADLTAVKLVRTSGSTNITGNIAITYYE